MSERLVLGTVEGRPRGRLPMRWTDQIKAAVGGPLHKCTRITTSRENIYLILKQSFLTSQERNGEKEVEDQRYLK